ncbi:hypothetical protein MTQ01_17880 [Streptomyces sp. XM4193]|uniref:Uncharacterized protein n=1 Tax=Streptomyces tardus TaxID=2780544 RepID=A0A949N3E3_9ACTN|nr:MULTISPECIES: hypothetical protein [Streptomyces]MBU7599945.1 hypothetical protein [Streptomyces tardus]MCK1797863.1 hypothetical protein [Streptomyces sp. XM4193]
MQHYPADQLPPAQDESDTSSQPGAPEPRGCLYALSQPPLMLFLAFIGLLFLLAAMHDLFLL